MAKQSGLLPALENGLERFDDRRDEFADAIGFLDVFRRMQIFVIDEAQQFRMVAVVIPDEMRETRHGVDRRDAVEVQKRAFRIDERGQRVFEHGGKELLLAIEVVIESMRSLVSARRAI